MSQSHIKSSTIMFSDVFGYSKMVGKDEKHALKLLDEHNEIIVKSMEYHHGSIIKFIGDAVFAEFNQTKDAARYAIDIIFSKITNFSFFHIF